VHTIGVDVGGTKCLGVVLAADGSVVAEHRTLTPRGSEAIVAMLAAMVQRLRVDMGEEIPTVGIGVPGLVDRSGVLRFAPNLPDVVDVDLARVLGKLLPGTALRVDNDATCAGWAERSHGAAVGADHVVLVALGTGIGGGIIVDGRVFRGSFGFAGEIGHMVVDPNGPPCPCGGRGCWERYASGTGLGRLGREAALGGRAARVVDLAGGDAEAVRGEHVTAAAAEGDEGAQAIMAAFGWWLALGLANLTCVFDPECFVIGGGLVAAGDLLLEPARRSFVELLEGSGHRPEISIVPALLGERAGAIGAAALART
jgi:glucokinase